jgi:hypothetical protein
MKRKKHSQEQAGAQPVQPMDVSSPMENSALPSRGDVAMQAYFIYLNQGCPQGCDLQHWLEAEARIQQPRNRA